MCLHDVTSLLEVKGGKKSLKLYTNLLKNKMPMHLTPNLLHLTKLVVFTDGTAKN